MNQKQALIMALENAIGMLQREGHNATGITTREGELDELTREEIVKVQKEMIKISRSLDKRLIKLKYKQ